MSREPLGKVPSVRQPAPPTPLSLTAGVLVQVLLLSSILRFSLVVYQFPAEFTPVLVMGLLGVAVSTVIWALPRHREGLVLLTLGLTGAMLLYNQALFVYGAQSCWEALTDFWTENTYFSVSYTLPYSLPDSQHQAATQIFLGAVFALLALPLGWAIHRLRAFWLTFALTLPWLLPAFLAEVELDWSAMLVICAGWAALLLSSLAARRDPSGGARITLVTLPVSLALIWLILLLFPFQQYTQPTWAVYLQEQLKGLDWFPSEETLDGGPSSPDAGQNAPRMDFYTAGPRSYTGRAMLEVSSSQPGTMYLRGEVYRDYSSQAWTGVEPNSTDNLSNYNPLLGTSPVSATITYLTSPRSMVYLPYQATMVEDKLLFRDTTVVFPRPQQDYTVGYAPLDDSPSSQGNIPTLSEQEEAYSAYLEVPEEISGELLTWYTQAMEELENSGEPIRADATGEYAGELNTASIIAQLLERNATYDLRTPRTPSEEDFVTYFLEESHRGYCVHFASAATLLLRTQGIPARYVSGYVTTIPSSSLDQNTREYTTRVVDSNAHAWVEIYLYGYGWYPVEVTPSSTNSDNPNQSQAPVASTAPSSAPTATSAPATPTPTPTVAPETPDQGGIQVSLDWLVWTVPVVVLAAGLWLVRQLRYRLWRKMGQDKDTNAAVLKVYRWFGLLERLGGKAGAETEDLARKARFSQHTLTQQERSLVLGQFRDEVTRLRQSASIWKRWLLWLLFPVGTGRRTR